MRLSERQCAALDPFFLGVPTQEAYRELVLTQHDQLDDAHPLRYYPPSRTPRSGARCSGQSGRVRSSQPRTTARSNVGLIGLVR